MDRVKQQFYCHFYGFLLSQTAWFFGFQLAIFNNFFNNFIEQAYQIKDSQQKIKISGNLQFFYLFGGLLCCISCSKLYENLGRYKSFIFLQFIGIVSVTTVQIQNLYLLYFLRLIYGYVACSYTILSIIMITEILPQKIGKIWYSFFYLFMSSGIVTSYLFSSKKAAYNWRFILSIPLIFDVPRFFFMISFYKIESPVFLMTKFYEDQKKLQLKLIENFSLFFTKQNSHEKTKFIIDQQILNQKQQYLNYKQNNKQQQSLLSKQYIKQFLITIYLNFLNQTTGINFLVLYSTFIFEQMQLDNAETLTFFMGFIKLLAGFTIIVLLKLLDLKDILVFGLLFQSISHFLLLIGYIFDFSILVVLGAYLFTFCFSCSTAGSLYPYQSLILPSRGISIASTSQWIVACFVGKYALVIVQKIGIFYTFYICMVMSFIGSIVINGFAVRVNRKSLQQIEADFQTKKFFYNIQLIKFYFQEQNVNNISSTDLKKSKLLKLFQKKFLSTLQNTAIQAKLLIVLISNIYLKLKKEIHLIGLQKNKLSYDFFSEDNAHIN